MYAHHDQVLDAFLSYEIIYLQAIIRDDVIAHDRDSWVLPSPCFEPRLFPRITSAIGIIYRKRWRGRYPRWLRSNNTRHVDDPLPLWGVDVEVHRFGRGMNYLHAVPPGYFDHRI